MNKIEKTCVVYQAFDGKEFTTKSDCEEYEKKSASEAALNLKHFDIEFPMQSSFISCTAYKINSENEFEMLKAYVLDEYYEMIPNDVIYDGNGWYVLEGEESGYGEVYKLSGIIQAWNKTMEIIAKNVMDFE